MNDETRAALRSLPPMSTLLEHPSARAAMLADSRSVVRRRLASVLGEARRNAMLGIVPPDTEALVARGIAIGVHSRWPIPHVINATGVVLHTGLGRAVLSREACEAAMQALSGHCALEIDLDTGLRDSRSTHVRESLCELTGAEDALVVNNNAGAVLLATTVMAGGGEVIVSRGQLVEIGGAFRLPDIVALSGAKLVEVGTTNCTRLSDYASAISERTTLLMRCTPSNYRVVGFTEEVSPEDLAALGQARSLPVLDDLGSGAIVGRGHVDVLTGPTMLQSVRTGCAVVTASGDKLLGGPQAGLIVGQARYVAEMARHPLARALRVDKVAIAALGATLRLYADPASAVDRIPTLRYIARDVTVLRSMARRLAAAIRRSEPAASVTVAEASSRIGGGSLPDARLPSVCVCVVAPEGTSINDLARRLRTGTPPVVARILGGRLWLDPRAMEADEIRPAALAVARALHGGDA